MIFVGSCLHAAHAAVAKTNSYQRRRQSTAPKEYASARRQEESWSAFTSPDTRLDGLASEQGTKPRQLLPASCPTGQIALAATSPSCVSGCRQAVSHRKSIHSLTLPGLSIVRNNQTFRTTFHILPKQAFDRKSPLHAACTHPLGPGPLA